MASTENELKEALRMLEKESREVEKEVKEKYSGIATQEIEKYVRKYLASSGLNKLLLLDFKLPSADLRSKLKVLAEGKVIHKTRGFTSKEIGQIESLRSSFYQILRNNGAFKIGEKTWAIIPGFEHKLIAQANMKLDELNKLIGKYGFPPRKLDLIEIYTPTKWVAQKLMENIREYEADISQLKKRLAEEELQEKQRKLITNRLSKLEKILDSLQKQYKALEKLEEERAKKYLKPEKGEEARVNETGEEIIYDISDNEKVPVKLKITPKPPESRNTWIIMNVYTGLKIKPYRSGKYLIAKKKKIYPKDLSDISFVAPVGSLVLLEYSDGSRKHVYNKIYKWFLVKKNGEYRGEIKDLKSGDLYTANTVRLMPLNKVPKDKLSEVEAEILNKGWKLSNYDPVRTLYYFWLKEHVGSEPVEEKVAKEAKLEHTVPPEVLEPVENWVEKLEEKKEKAKRYIRI